MIMESINKWYQSYFCFLSKNVLGLLVEKFNIKSIATPEKDLEEILGQSN